MGFHDCISFFRFFEVESFSWAPILNVIHGFGYFLPKSLGNASSKDYAVDAFKEGSIFSFCYSVLVWGIPSNQLSDYTVGATVLPKISGKIFASNITFESFYMECRSFN